MPAYKKQFKNTDTYIKTFPKNVQTILRKVRQTIRKAAPGAEEMISYQIPSFKLNGKYLIYFAAWKNHISIYPIPSGNAAFKKQLSKYITGKGTIQFPLDKPIPLSLVTKTVKYRIKANKEKICSRGHKFDKSNKHPVCPVCWPGYYKKRPKKTKSADK